MSRQRSLSLYFAYTLYLQGKNVQLRRVGTRQWRPSATTLVWATSWLLIVIGSGLLYWMIDKLDRSNISDLLSSAVGLFLCLRTNRLGHCELYTVLLPPLICTEGRYIASEYLLAHRSATKRTGPFETTLYQLPNGKEKGKLNGGIVSLVLLQSALGPVSTFSLPIVPYPAKVRTTLLFQS